MPAYGKHSQLAMAGASWSTIWIWLVVLIPLLPLLLLLLVPWGAGFDYDPWSTDVSAILLAQFAPYVSPAFLTSMASSYATYGICVFFAYLDYKELSNRGYLKPFHWGWAFLSPVYPIGRSVIVKRHTGRGLAPVWTVVAGIGLSILIAFVITITISMEAVRFFERALATVPS